MAVVRLSGVLRRLNICGAVNIRAKGLENIGQRGHEIRDVCRSGAMPHAADAENLSRQLAEAARDLDVVMLEEVVDDVTVVDPVRDPDCVERRQPVLILGIQLEAHRLDARFERAGHLAVALPALLDALLGDQPEGLADRVDVHHLDEGGIEVPDERRAHRPEDAGMDVARTRAHERMIR